MALGASADRRGRRSACASSCRRIRLHEAVEEIGHGVGEDSLLVGHGRRVVDHDEESTLSMAGCGTTVVEGDFVVGSAVATSRVRHAAVESAENARIEVSARRRDMHGQWPRAATPVRLSAHCQSVHHGSFNWRARRAVCAATSDRGSAPDATRSREGGSSSSSRACERSRTSPLTCSSSARIWSRRHAKSSFIYEQSCIRAAAAQSRSRQRSARASAALSALLALGGARHRRRLRVGSAYTCGAPSGGAPSRPGPRGAPRRRPP